MPKLVHHEQRRLTGRERHRGIRVTQLLRRPRAHPSFPTPPSKLLLDFLEVQGTIQNPVAYFVVDGPRCSNLHEKIAEFQAGPPTPKTATVRSDKRIYILVNHRLGYKLDRQGNPLWPVECKSLQSFVPAEGKRYQVLPRLASEHACSANVLDTGSKGFAPGFRIEREHSACNPALPPDRR